MSPRPPNPLIQYLYEALAHPFGVILRTTGDRRSLVARIYSLRKEAADPSLAVLSVSPSPTSPDEVWIINKGTSNESEV